VGIQISLEKGQLTVVSPLEDTPAYEAGIQPADTIVGIDGKSTKGITLTKAVQTITGPVGTQVTLTIRREGAAQDFDVPLTRANITIHTVKGYARGDRGGWDYMIDRDQRIAYVRLTSFNEHTTDELRAALETVKAQDARGLVLDLRFNPGGLLRTAVEVADLFLDGAKMIVKTKGRPAVSPEWSQTANQGEACPGLPLIVLVNRASASASEIVAGAIQDNRRGIVIGQRSYGKGSVQNLVPLTDGSAYLKLTTAFYYLPSGRCIDRQQGKHQEWGVDPDIPVVLIPEETRKVLELRRDSDILRGRADTSAAGASHDAASSTQPAEATGDPPAAAEADDDVPDVDPQLETALLVMRVKLTSGLAWDTPEASTASVGIAPPTN
jgi:carboxyl-terminal processing protease